VGPVAIRDVAAQSGRDVDAMGPGGNDWADATGEGREEGEMTGSVDEILANVAQFACSRCDGTGIITWPDGRGPCPVCACMQKMLCGGYCKRSKGHAEPDHVCVGGENCSAEWVGGIDAA
jgi:hypothetical protein